MSSKTTQVKLQTRIQHKHDIPENWARATFVPLAGELIIYDDHYFDDNGNKVVVADVIKYKVGDGVTPIYELPFVEVVDLVSDQTISGEKTFINKIALSDKDANKKYIALDSTDVNITEKVTIQGTTGTAGTTSYPDNGLPITHYVAYVERTADYPIKRIEIDSTLHTVSYTPGETQYTVNFRSPTPSKAVSAILTITYDVTEAASYILPAEVGTFATQEWVEKSLSPVAKSGKFDDLIINWDTALIFDGGGADTQVAVLDETILI